MGFLKHTWKDIFPGKAAREEAHRNAAEAIERSKQIPLKPDTSDQ